MIEEERLKESFTQIPNTILRRPEITPGAKLTYMLLLSYAWQQDSCFPGQATLAEDLGAGRRSVIRYLQELQERGLLRVKRRGLGKTNVYTLTKWNEPRSARLAPQEVPQTTPLQVPDWHRKKTQETHTQKEQDPSSNDFEDENDDEAEVNVRASNGVQATETERRSRPRGLTPIGSALRHYRPDLQSGRGSQHGGPAPVESRDHARARTEPSGRVSSHRPTTQIELLVDEFSDELGDAEHVASNVSQALRLWKRSHRSEAVFVQLLYEARSRSRQASTTAARDEPGASRPVRKRMPYFFACLRDLLEPVDEQSEHPALVGGG